MLRSRRMQTWGGFALGLLTAPLVMFTVARIVTALYGGLDTSGESGVAIAGARDLAAAVDRYRARHHHIPDAKQGLAALGPEFLEHVPDDPWGRPYIYEPSGPEWADVLSYGADGRAGGSGAAADISARYGRLGSRPPGSLRMLAALVLTGLALGAAIAAPRHLWCASALAGMSGFWGIIVLATVGTPLRTALLPWVCTGTSFACLVGAIAMLQKLRYAPVVCLLAIVSAYLLLQLLVGA